MMLYLLLIIVCLPQLISSSKLALTFDAASSTCTAACSTCDANKTVTINNTGNVLEELLNTTRHNAEAIKQTKEAVEGIINSLSHIKNTTTSNAGAINKILMLVENLMMLHNDTFSPLPISCQEVQNKQPNSPSGVYLLATDNGTKHIYCHIGELCGSGGGWTRLAYLNMTDSTGNCPSGFKLYESGGVRACGRAASNVGSCTSVQFPSNGISYSQVCGRVVGYQYGGTDAAYPGRFKHGEEYGSYIDPNHNDINSYYVDGVSITSGSPRQHVWTLMAGLIDHDDKIYTYHSNYNCPCTTGSPQNSTLQSFIGDDYFCESGNPTAPMAKFFTSDPLWDKEGCTADEMACCKAPGLPWFSKIYPNTTTDYLELRVCGEESTDDENVPVSFYELYVK